MALLGLLLTFGWSAPSSIPAGGLDPNHVALIFNKNSRHSGKLAMLYADKRGIPKEQMIGLDVTPAEEMHRGRFEPDVAGPIREWLIERKLADRIACLVTFYDIPIRVGQRQPTVEDRAALRVVQTRRNEALEVYGKILAEVDLIARPVAKQPTSGPKPQTRADGIRNQYRRALLQAMKRAQRIREPDQARALKRQLLESMEQAFGVSGIISHIQQNKGGQSHLGKVQLEKLRRVVRQGHAAIQAVLAKGVASPERQESYGLIRKIAGVVGLLAHLESDMKQLKGVETHAALDSELSLLWARPANLYRWRANTLNARMRADPTVRASRHSVEFERPAIMVSRLDGPNPGTVRRIIEDAVATEKVGLKGHAYFDARGLAASGKPGSYGSYDENLRDLAKLVRAETKIPTVLDNRKALFGPGACPDTAIYCGWYSLAKYRDAFDFVRGSVAYHIASAEAVSLRKSKRKYWCRALLQDGAAVTLGPVAEPYLLAFPKPREFFGLLLTGKFSLVECYYYTKPYNSWMMLLIGDPLYRPFAVNPQLKIEDVLHPDTLPIKPIPTSRPTQQQGNEVPGQGSGCSTGVL